MIRTAIVVRAIRRQMGWTRKDLARMLGFSVAYVERVERGEQELCAKAAARLCEATGTELNRIM